ncbi:purine-cytosine permease family protein [Streptomyces sp. NPDC058001]|uniref:purine-cytosine permease family protein n=1 Tax=Streptomyces sp. NPDC058001 TaxID=3346300 RepID=UPI0036E24E6B
MALFSSMFWFVLAGSLTLAVGTVNTLIALVLSVVVFGGINYLITRQAAASGLTVVAYSRVVFGNVGSRIAAAVYAATAIYFTVFEGSVIAIGFREYFQALPLNFWYAVVILYSVPLIFGGVQRWLDRFNGVLLPFYLVGIVAAIVWTITEYGFHTDWLTYAPAHPAAISGPGWWYAFTAFMGIWVIMLYTWDYARLSRPKDVKFHGTVTFGPVFYFATVFLNGVIGIFLAHTIPTPGGLSEASVVTGLVSLMGIAGLVLVWISQTRINTVNFYVASATVQSLANRVLRRHVPRMLTTALVGVVVYLCMLADVFSFLNDALRYQGVVVVSWVCVLLVHGFSPTRRALGRAGQEFRVGRIPRFNGPGTLVWVVSSATGLLILVEGGAFGTTWAAPITAVTAAVLYQVALLVSRDRPHWYALRRPHDPRDEVTDVWEDRVECAGCGRSYLALEMDRDPGRGHEPVCTACAESRPGHYRAALDEARHTAPASPPPPPPGRTGPTVLIASTEENPQ